MKVPARPAMEKYAIKKNKARTKNISAQMPCLVSCFKRAGLPSVSFGFFFAIRVFYHTYKLRRNEFLKSNLSPQACGANFSSLKRIIVRVLTLFSKLLRKAF